VYNGAGWAQLLAPLDLPPEPTYTLTADSATVNEGASVVFTLQTTHVPANTKIAYTLSGTGITAADLVSGSLTGELTVSAQGSATLVVALKSDGLSEGAESLRLLLGEQFASAEVTINDTSVTPPTYALTASQDSRNEGSSVTYQLATTNVPANTEVSYTLSGAGITADDVVGGALTGKFVVDAEGKGSVTIAFVSDNKTEGDETLILTLSGGANLPLTIIDSSLSPTSNPTPDTLVLADAGSGSGAHAPTTPAEGEITINTHLNYDFLNQSSGIVPTRMSITTLKASGPTAGAPLDLTNRSADRGNIPQVSNQGLRTFDLGSGTDRVDYSAESGKIVAVFSAQAPADTMYLLVNDDATDNGFSDASDRMDILKAVEEVAASQGGGVLDLTGSGQDLQVAFSRSFNPATHIGPGDRATHRVQLNNLDTGSLLTRSFIEYRDGGTSTATAEAALWTTVEGGDRDEALIFTGHQSTEQRSNVLRGGNNEIRFSELVQSILVDVAIVPWQGSTSAADDVNTSGRVTATTSFSNGDGTTLLSSATNITSSHTPDNLVAPGTLRIAASGDVEDAISFSGVAQSKVFSLGAQSVGVRLATGSTVDALVLTGFEALRDNGASDDVYVISSIASATTGNLRLVDAAGGDHDLVRIGTEALGSAAVGGAAGTINFATLNSAPPGLNFDFDVLDISAITGSGLQVIGTSGADDELVVGRLGAISRVTQFESVVLTTNSNDRGNVLTLNLDTGAVMAEVAKLFDYSGNGLSLGGLQYASAGQAELVAAVSTGFSVTVVDSTPGAGAMLRGSSAADLLKGDQGNDTLRGGGGHDTLDGGAPTSGSFGETWTFTLTGGPDSVAQTGNRVSLVMSIDGTTLTMSEAAVADTSYGDRNGAVVDGSTGDVIGAAMAAMINANLATINNGSGTGTLANASFDAITDKLVLTFASGTNANDVVWLALNPGAAPDSGSLAVSSGVNVNGGNDGIDTFVFEKSGAANGIDTILNFVAGSDKLDVRAFTGAAVTTAATAIDGAVGGTLAGVSTTVEFVSRKSALIDDDFATVPTTGRLVIPDGGRSVIVVSVDPTGSHGDSTVSTVSIYFVENGAAAGTSDLTVSLAGVVSGPTELTFAEIFTALG